MPQCRLSSTRLSTPVATGLMRSRLLAATLSSSTHSAKCAGMLGLRAVAVRLLRAVRVANWTDSRNAKSPPNPVKGAAGKYPEIPDGCVRRLRGVKRRRHRERVVERVVVETVRHDVPSVGEQDLI